MEVHGEGCVCVLMDWVETPSLRPSPILTLYPNQYSNLSCGETLTGDEIALYQPQYQVLLEGWGIVSVFVFELITLEMTLLIGGSACHQPGEGFYLQVQWPRKEEL